MKKIHQTELNSLIQNHNIYIETLTDIKKRGKKLVLDEVDFTDNDLSSLNFADTYITSSLFKSHIFKSNNFGDAKLYDCTFENVIFENCNLGKTIFDYSQITKSKFYMCNLLNLETIETCFEEILLNKCLINDAFSYCSIKRIEFIECTFSSTEFWQCIIKNMRIFTKDKKCDIKKCIKEINIGTIERPIIIKGETAIKYFENNCVINYLT